MIQLAVTEGRTHGSSHPSFSAMSISLSLGRVEELDTPRGHLAFIQSQWRDFAAFAFEKFLSQGRGAVVIDLRSAEKPGDNLRVPTHYIADRSERLRKLGGWPSNEIEEIVQTYNPEQDVVFLFLRLDGDVFHYNVADDVTPPEAYSAKPRKENELLS